ncbi:MAG: haloacid dehalogenase-like hydrolase [Candidatus Aminicenantes bacterium]|nr:MAG: haloacid dehalogenase-like hydrolase [Candidatus Aminicenantes bacterium]
MAIHLQSWNECPAKKSILDFVADVTDEGSQTFVSPHDRIAVFDNDGTLWAEKPAYFQLLFALERVKALAPENPGWKTKQPFKAVLEGDMKSLAAAGDRGIIELVMESTSGMTTDEFSKIVSDWMTQAKHPRFHRPYTDLAYQPMLELLDYLRMNGFKTYIVSGGGIEFMRVWMEGVYGIPPEQVIGSSIITRFEIRDNTPVLLRQPMLDFHDDKAGKPVAINKFIGRRPIFAFGNSDGDLQMLQWTASGKGQRFMGIIHHTDAEREWDYDRYSMVGRLDKALDEANSRGWTIVDMKKDWKRIFVFELR